ncbi:MAG: M48 family metallopeptidase [Opitutales bacterium]|jgi:metalloendopeptidase OMA1, mitochondrial
MSKLFTILTSLTLIVLMSGCGAAVLPEEFVASQGHAAFRQMKRKEKVSNNPKHNAMVTRIAKRLAEVSDIELPKTEWEFVVFESDAINAFALPGGKVGVYTGLIDLVDSDDELAAVIGHEIAHVAFRHGNKRMSQGIGLALGGVLLNSSMRNKDRTDRQVAQIGYGVGSQLLVALPYGRKQETEADDRGLMYAALAGYDPRAAVTFWKKMKAKSKVRPPEFLSTHPDTDNRIAFLESKMDQAMRIYRQSKKARGETP